MSEYVFPTKFCIAVGFSAVCLLLLCHESSRKRVCGMSWAVLSFAFVMPRLLAFGLLYIAVQLPAQSDVGVYLEHARLVMAGKRPFIDFETAYGPWFLVLCSWALRLWNSGAVLVLLAILFEFIAWGFWICVMRDLMEERDAKLSACLYALAPLPFLNVAMVGMNHVWITAFLGVATLWQRRDRHALSALAMGASVVVVKFLSLLWVPLMFWCSRKKISWAIGFAVLPVVAYSLVIIQGASFAAQIAMHAHYDSSGNIPFLLGLTGVDASSPAVRTVFNVIGIMVLVTAFGISVLTLRLRTIGQLFFALPLFTLIVLLVSKKAFSSYLEITLFPLAALAVLERHRARTVAWFVIMLITTSIEPSLWFRWLHQNELSHLLYWREVVWRPPMVQLVTFVLVDVLMLISYTALGWRLWRLMSPKASGELLTAL